MWQYAIKIALTALIAVAVSEIAKRSTLWAAVLASLPLTSLMAIVWLYVETGDIERVAQLSISIVWLVVPSLLLLIAFPLLLRAGTGFWTSLAASSVATVAAYAVMVRVLGAFDVQL